MLDKQYEDLQLLENYDYILGVDEVGRGCLAGPVSVCCTLINKNTKLVAGVTDSKKVSKKKREVIFKSSLQDSGFMFSLFDISNNQIDKIGITKSICNAIIGSVNNVLNSLQDSSLKGILLVDGYFKENFGLKIDSKMIIKGDNKCYSIGLASILAKVHRDQLMNNISRDYPQYGFSTNVGYGTKAHLSSLKKFGYSKYHRRSFEPLKSAIINNSILPI